jgi:hypothetical protein
VDAATWQVFPLTAMRHYPAEHAAIR